MGQAEKLGLSVSDEELAAAVKKAKDEGFKSEAEFQKTLHELHRTEADYELGIKKELLDTKIEEWEKEKAPEPRDEIIEADHNAETAGYKPRPEERTFHFIINKDRAKAERALVLVGIHNGTLHHEWGKAADFIPNTRRRRTKAVCRLRKRTNCRRPSERLYSEPRARTHLARRSHQDL